MSKRDCNRIVWEILKEQGFSRVKGEYFKLHGDAILSFLWVLADRIWAVDHKYELVMSVQSMHNHEFAEDFYTPNLIQGSMRKLTRVSARSLSWRSMRNADIISELSDEEETKAALIQSIQEVESIAGPSDLYDLMCRNDVSLEGGVLIIDTNKIAPLLLCGRYDEALEYCEAIVEQNEGAFADKMEDFKDRLSREEFDFIYNVRKKALAGRLEYLHNMIQWIHDKNTEKIEETLSTDYQRNIEYARNTLRIL